MEAIKRPARLGITGAQAETIATLARTWPNRAGEAPDMRIQGGAHGYIEVDVYCPDQVRIYEVDARGASNRI